MSPRRVTILRKGLLLLALPLIYQALFIGLLAKRQYDHNAAQHWVVHTKEVLAQTDRIFRALLTSQSNLRGWILTESSAFADEIEQGEAGISDELAGLKRLVQDNPAQEQRFTRVERLVKARLDYEKSMTAIMKTQGRERAQQEVKTLRGKAIMDDLSREIDGFRMEEEKLDTERLKALEASSVLQNWLLGGGLVVNIGIGALAAAMFSREISSRVQTVAENTRRIGRGEALPPVIEGTDEIHELDEKLHLMADDLVASRVKERSYKETIERRATELEHVNLDLGRKNQEIEMFVYSVSHDLRSPLVNLQGFSRELGFAQEELRRLLSTDLTLPERERAKVIADRDIAESIRFIQSAVTRLSTIIDALLRLSRAGRVDYHPKWIEPGPIIHRIVEAMSATIAERGAEITVGELPAVWADAAALEQIFANLIGNAVNYLDAARPGRIHIGACDREMADLESAQTYFVKDNGLGIAVAYLPKVFAIFQRLHGNVASGEGVGLALVRRVVERHNGRVWVESTEGVGSTFFVALPKGTEFSPPATIAPKKESVSVLARTL